MKKSLGLHLFEEKEKDSSKLIEQRERGEQKC